MNVSDIDDKKRAFLNTLAQTGRMKDAREAAGLSHYEITGFRKSDAHFEQSIQACQEAAIDDAFDRLDQVLETYPNPQQAKVYSDNVKWRLAKLRPERFGDRLDLKTTLTIDLTDRFAKALERLTVDRQRPSRDLTDFSEAQVIDIIPQYDSSAAVKQTDHMPLAAADRPAIPRLAGQDERDFGDRGVACPAPQNAAQKHALPPLQTNRDEEKVKDYADLEDPL